MTTKRVLFLFSLSLQFGISFGQTNPAEENFKLRGRWNVCVAMIFSKDFSCDKGYMTYEFFENGTFKDARPSVDGGGEHAFSSGTWELKNGMLTIDYDDTRFRKSPPVTIRITFLTDRKFYTKGTEKTEDVIVYTYFQRTD
jgi:hypothetical protein